MSQMSMQRLADLLDKGIVVLDDKLIVHGWNKWMEVCSGISKEKAIGDYFDLLFPEVDRPTLLRKIKTTIALNSTTFHTARNGQSLINLKTHSISSGQFDTMQLQVMIQPMEENRVIMIISDYTALSEANCNLTKLNQRLIEEQEIIDRNVLMMTTKSDGTIIDVSTAFCEASGFTRDELIGNKPNVFKHKNAAPELYIALWNTLMAGEVWRGEFHNRRKDGSDWWVDSIITPRFNDQGILVEFKAILHDITDKKQVEWLSVTDPLTKVYNRAKFDSAIKSGIHEAVRYGRPLSLILMDIDHFKAINDNFGHQAGDSVLVEAASRAGEVLRASDLLARWGGEEFAILLPFTHLESAVGVAQKLREAIADSPFDIVGHVTSSFGVTEYLPGDTAEKMLARADYALYAAKRSGRNMVCEQV
ncbi:MAG: diguanylate cyclase [Campylobacterales bacterium]